MKTYKKLALSSTLFTLILLLSGCSSRDADGNYSGFFYELFVVPTKNLIIMLANVFGGSYGMAIIAITIILRILILPLSLNQMKKSMIQQEKTAAIKPQLDDIQRRQKEATTQEEKVAVQQEMMALYKENNISMTGGIGCLPMIIQMLVFSALFQAISSSTEIADSSFFGLNLGQPNHYMAIAAGLIYVGQAFISMIGLTPEQKKAMRTMLFISPVMILMFSWGSPAGLGLYWFVGGIIACGQTLISNLVHKPKIKAEIAEAMKNRPVQNPKVQKAKPIEATEVNSKPNKPSDGKRRNEGKQKR
ncbi:membrane protein insertase YidC [Isobaculum melis]|uniref:Membrane protein insertase YidC n=1 Tax=Isobaculum melis TaxID=142588 RepID=A0A1H9UHD9_9LACT|nr:membrane protein insertase YidC [Isobaculum melis]SES08604.1 YidC/Oxa1 family membrane protein insertase [Isobaculum melis]